MEGEVILKDRILFSGLRDLQEYEEVLSCIDQAKSPTAIYGLFDSQIPHLVYALNQSKNRQCLIITYSEYQAKKILEDLKFFGESNCYEYPGKELIFYNYEAHSHQLLEQRLNTLLHIIRGEKGIVVASVESMLDASIPRSVFKRYFLKLSYGATIELDKIIQKFVQMGYERVERVEAKGQFCIRGGIIDFFTMDGDVPYRIELFDDEIDSIRKFDIESQRSLEQVREVTVYPAREFLLEPDCIQKGIQEIQLDFQKISSNLEEEKRTRLEEKIKQLLENIKTGAHVQGIENYLNYFYKEPESFIDFLEPGALIFIDEPSRVREKANASFYEFKENFSVLLEKGEVLPRQGDLMNNYKQLLFHFQNKQVFLLSNLPKDHPDFSIEGTVKFASRMVQNFHGKIDLLTEELKQYKRRGYRAILLCGTEQRALHLEDELKQNGVECVYLPQKDRDIQKGQIVILEGYLRKGFEYLDSRMLLMTEDEIFGTVKKKRRLAKRKDARPIKSFTDLELGDYIVHENHGIGKYIGIEQLNVQGAKKDYLKIKYAGKDLLYVPIEQMDLVQKYIGSDQGIPKLSKLGGTEWKKAKAKAKGAIADMAEELLKLNAMRQTAQGYAFSPDTVWQKQFEDLFPYEETPDQLRCIQEVKRDMEKMVPMDRLLCGDVGYGKTEVAIRAVFKCVMDGKQAAFLVPTTILAQQHYNTFIERFQPFPVTVEMLSRFRTEKQQKQIIKKIREGNIDIVIGTHRILSKDIKFKDLGLLIIDEEQRFGVQHKEALKQLKKNVDVLTLTATPIPRTLHMSLIGLRDMSLIEDPPEERYPVQTYVIEYNEEIVRDAILRELGRKGQVYFVFNRVRGIQQMAAKVANLVPEAKIAVAHGQMGERELENVMMDFMNKKYDILLCTTIIETGLDISNVNTLIVYDADRMGLAQLYQLRGRVGRSNRIAYAYLCYQKDKILSEAAEKRLKAIKEFTEFGSGFKIAMRDLEIRGAGNLLGSEQHGHMEAIGYDLYCKLLEETVKEIKGEALEIPVETAIELNISAFIPETYIQNESDKIEIYKKIASIRNQQDMVEIEEELEDRFGQIPEPVQNLIIIAYIKALAQKIGVIAITETKAYAKLDFDDVKRLEPGWIKEIVRLYGSKIYIDAGLNPSIRFYYHRYPKRHKEIREFLEKINSFIQN